MLMITLFGCGAIGSQLAMHLVRPDIMFHLYDDDRVTEDNLSTSAFMREQVGTLKTLALSNLLYRKNKGVSLMSAETLNEARYRMMMKPNRPNLVIDCFDNVEARRITCAHFVPTLHVGVSREGTGSVTWDTDFKIFDGAPRGEDTFCTHLAGRRIIRLTACLAANIVDMYIETGEKQSLVVTDKLTILK
jgi:tRNA A37 threonylcarbamoyladenosine dehydratase